MGRTGKGREARAGARTKLNQAYFTGSAVLAAVVGGLCESWTAFLAALMVLVAANLFRDEIRPGKPRG